VSVLTLAGPGSSTAHYALITVADLKVYLRDAGLAGGSEDTNLGYVVDGLNRDAHGLLRGRFVLDTGITWDQVYDTAASRFLYLDQRPIVSVALCEYGYYQDGTWTALESFTGSDYIVDADAGRLLRTPPWCWPATNMGLRVQYRAGYTATPPDLKLKLCQWGKVLWNRITANRIDVTSISHETEGTQYRMSELPDETARLLEYYARKEML
jgi:hypothetical protein